MRTINIDQNSTARGKAIELADQVTELNIHDPKYWQFVDDMEILFNGGDIPELTEAENKLLEKLDQVENSFEDVSMDVNDISYRLREIRTQLEKSKNG